jgi:uncharacterized RDD family membrane protein YckC
MAENRMRLEAGRLYAGFKQRIAAFGIDYLIIIGYIVLLFLAATLLIRTMDLEGWINSPFRQDLVAFISLVLPVILYFSLSESSARQATIGKRKLGLKVVNGQGERVSAGQALLRSALKFLPWQLAHTAVIQLVSGNNSPFIFALSILAQTSSTCFLSGWINTTAPLTIGSRILMLSIETRENEFKYSFVVFSIT